MLPGHLLRAGPVPGRNPEVSEELIVRTWGPAGPPHCGSRRETGKQTSRVLAPGTRPGKANVGSDVGASLALAPQHGAGGP